MADVWVVCITGFYDVDTYLVHDKDDAYELSSLPFIVYEEDERRPPPRGDAKCLSSDDPDRDHWMTRDELLDRFAGVIDQRLSDLQSTRDHIEKLRNRHSGETSD